MPKVTFLPLGTSITVDPQTKILIAAKKAQVNIRFGCAACRCGTCGVKVVEGSSSLSAMDPDEKALLTKIGLDAQSGEIRLACRAKVTTQEVAVDLDFQQTYEPEVEL